ncbi:MAG: carboxypeptidase regulatory-like domain-containing protein, partial [Bryobacterales bacterium]|nr:carboxypeptidase regulatory-like domain-containing protein [Bryobacterales bacterium]
MLLRFQVPLALLAFIVPLAGQGDRASILGTVMDGSGAAVPGAGVTVTNTGTREKRAVVSDERGSFELPALNIGEYEVAVEHTGFKREVIRGLVLVVGQRARVDVQLELGALTQEVTVQGAAALLSTDDATLGQLIDQKKIRELPIPGKRN